MLEPSTLGWLPIALQLDPRPALGLEAAVRWVEFGDTPLTEPFLDDTVARLRGSTPPAREMETNIEGMLRLSGQFPGIAPAGFIFHISRCGSTLIANGLKTAQGVQVVSESQPVTKLLLPGSQTAGTYLNDRWDRTRRMLLDALFSSFAHYRTGSPERVVIKFTSINILCMSLVRAHWPEVPCVVVVRDPVEVMVASMAGGGWMGLKSAPQSALEIFGWPGLPSSVEEMSNEEYIARVLRRYFESALDALGGHPCMIVDYEDLNPKRIRDIAAFFKIDIPARRESLDQVFSVYAKDPARSRPYQDDRERKRRSVSDSMRHAVRQWAMEFYVEVRSRNTY